MIDNSKFVKSLQVAAKHIVHEREIKLKKACLLIERDAKKECPVDNGYLRASITSEVHQTPISIIGMIYSNLDYAPYVEMGTGIYTKDGKGRLTPWNWGNQGSSKWPGRRGWQGSRPHPFLQPAIDKNRAYIAEMLGGK